MGYPSIDKFDFRFIERTISNVGVPKIPNTFTHLINSLIGLIFIPAEFKKKGRRTYTIDFLNKPIADYELLNKIFSGEVNLQNEHGQLFIQNKFSRYDKRGKKATLVNTTVGELVRLFRNGIAHQNITPVGEGGHWIGVIVRNFQDEKKERAQDFNFETYLTQRELEQFAMFIGQEYLKNAK